MNDLMNTFNAIIKFITGVHYIIYILAIIALICLVTLILRHITKK